MFERIKVETGQVARTGKTELQRSDVGAFVGAAVPKDKRKLRAGGVAIKLMDVLDAEGFFEYHWRVAYRLSERRDGEAVVRAHVLKDAPVENPLYHLFLFGDQVGAVLDRVNDALYPYQRQSERELERVHRAEARREAVAKRRRRRRVKPDHRPKPQTKKEKKRVFVPAAISRRRLLLDDIDFLTPQYPNTYFSWHQAICSIAYIFEVRRTSERAAREVIDEYMRDSLRRSGGAFAQYKRHGFTFRVDLAWGIWAGDLTRVTLSCNKKLIGKLNKKRYRLYRRMRERLADITSRPLTEQKYWRDQIRAAITFDKVAA